jgi:predicted DNA binding CopG/RHH family protein
MAPELLALTAAHGGQDLRVFGSVIHGAAGLQSDVDLLVDFPSSPSFEQYMDLKLALEDLPTMNPLDHEEQEILEAFEAGTLRSVATAAERSRLEASGRSTATKDQRINIRLTSEDLGALLARALQEGIPYQTLISSVLHKYVCGRLLDRP